MNEKRYSFPLAIQVRLPEDYRTNQAFGRQLGLLADYGFRGVELNIARPAETDPADILSFLNEAGLELTVFASGLTAKTLGLSLSHQDEDVRRRSVEQCLRLLDFCGRLGVGIIVGFLQGGVMDDVQGARDRFRWSLDEVAPHAEECRVPFVLEAVNRYISSVANSLAGTYELIRDHAGPYVRMLPDTFHMNIEERDLIGALKEFAPHFDSVHLSDNNRLCPGLGAIDFERIIDALRQMGYNGGVAIEAEIEESFEKDLERSMRYLAPILEEGG